MRSPSVKTRGNSNKHVIAIVLGDRISSSGNHENKENKSSSTQDDNETGPGGGKGIVTMTRMSILSICTRKPQNHRNDPKIRAARVLEQVQIL